MLEWICGLHYIWGTIIGIGIMFEKVINEYGKGEE